MSDGTAAAARTAAVAATNLAEPWARASLLPGAASVSAASAVEHIVVLCMENRSVDHYLGWVPGAEGIQAGLTYNDDAGTAHFLGAALAVRNLPVT